MRYLVIVRPTRTGFSADAPDLPGCIAAAGTIKGVRKLMSEAMGLHLEAMRADGEKLPKPRRRVQLDSNDFDDEDFCTWIEVATKLPRLKQHHKATAT